MRRRMRVTLMAALLGSSAGASAATLNNGGSPISLVIPSGTTFSMANTTSLVWAGGPMTDSCAAGTLDGVVVHNGSGGNPIELSITAATVTSCTYPTVQEAAAPWPIGIPQSSPPWSGGGSMRTTITYGGATCRYFGSSSPEWIDGAPSRLDFGGGSLGTSTPTCPTPVTVSGRYQLTRVGYRWASNNMVIG